MRDSGFLEKAARGQDPLRVAHSPHPSVSLNPPVVVLFGAARGGETQ